MYPSQVAHHHVAAAKVVEHLSQWAAEVLIFVCVQPFSTTAPVLVDVGVAMHGAVRVGPAARPGRISNALKDAHQFHSSNSLIKYPTL